MIWKNRDLYTYQREESKYIQKMMELWQNYSYNNVYPKGLSQNYLFHYCSYLYIRWYKSFHLTLIISKLSNISADI